jgi:hypothetical protein
VTGCSSSPPPLCGNRPNDGCARSAGPASSPDGSANTVGDQAKRSRVIAADWQLAVSRGYEIQIDDSGYNPDTNTSGDPAHETGAIYAIQALSTLSSNPIGQWNTYRIRAQADKLNVWLNGTHVITDFVVDNVRPRKGHIGLQNHSGVTGPSLAGEPPRYLLTCPAVLAHPGCG